MKHQFYTQIQACTNDETNGSWRPSTCDHNL